jgi:hypothetical protein
MSPGLVPAVFDCIFKRAEKFAGFIILSFIEFIEQTSSFQGIYVCSDLIAQFLCYFGGHSLYFLNMTIFQNFHLKRCSECS